jgi:hypothetical protein
MTWKIEEAQEQFLEVVNASGQTPQLIYQRDRFVAAVIRADLFQEFLTWQQQQKRTSLADTFDELRQICIAESYTFEISPRCDRPNPFAEMLP